MRKAIFVGLFIVSSAIGAQTAFATTCSVEQQGSNPSVSWVANAPANMTAVVKNKLLLDAYAKDAEGKISEGSMPSAVLTCFGSEGNPIKAQRISIISVVKTCPASDTTDSKTKTACAPEYEAKVSPY